MPIYEYTCAGCGREFEKYLASATADVACPQCSSAKVKRRLSIVGVKTGGSVMSTAGLAGGGCCGGGCACH